MLRKLLDKYEPHFHEGGKWEKMYALYEANKDSFENNDINKIQYGQELVLQEEMIFAMSPGEANDVVNRHIYCGC